MSLKKLRVLFWLISLLAFPVKSYADQLSIGQTLTVYLNPSIPSGGWITSANWSTNVVGLNCFNGGTWGTGLKVDGYWSDTATLSCMYTYSYYGYDNNIHVGHATEYWYYTCKGYPISLRPTSVTLNKGEKATLTFKITGGKLGNIAAKWVSSDTQVASVYAAGDYSATVTAKYPGTSVITCYSYMGEPVECLVTVNSFAPTSITVSPSEVDVKEGKSVQLTSKLFPDGASASCAWRSDNTSIATVQNGKVTGVSTGKTKIWVNTDNGLSACSEVTVISNKPTDISVSPQEAKVMEGEYIQLKAIFTPDDAASICTWSSDNTLIATVVDGKVKGVSAGKTKIRVRTDNGLSAVAEITVIGRGSVSSSLSGDGTVTSPYIIACAADLRYLSNKVNGGTSFEGKYFKQTTDITINTGSFDSEYFKSQEIWIPIGKTDKEFKGIYDGDNHFISGIYITDYPELFESFRAFGLFGEIYNATIKNLKIENCYIDISSDVAAIVGRAEGSSGEINNCHVFNSYIKGDKVAGITIVSYRDVLNCSNSATIVGFSQAAGIIRNGEKCDLINCINFGSITCESNAAGIIQITSGSIYNCCNAGNIESKDGYSAGILGESVERNKIPMLVNCVNYGNLESDSYKTAALIYKRNRKTCKLKDCYYVKDFDPRGETTGISMSNVKGVTDAEMKSTIIIDDLNNAGNPQYAMWVPGYDGYPTFNWYKEISAGVEECISDNMIFENFLSLPVDTVISVYSLSGACIYIGTKEHMPELRDCIVIVVTPYRTFKIYR